MLFLTGLCVVILLAQGPFLFIRGLIEGDGVLIGLGLAMMLSLGIPALLIYLSKALREADETLREQRKEERDREAREDPQSLQDAIESVDSLIAEKPADLGAPKEQTDKDRGWSESFWTIEQFTEDPSRYWVRGEIPPRPEERGDIGGCRTPLIR